MLTKEDTDRIEKANDVVFEKGRVVGDCIKKNLKIVLRVSLVVGAIVVLGTLFFFAGLFSGKKESILKPIIK